MARLAIPLAFVALALSALAEDCPDDKIPFEKIPLDVYCETDADCPDTQRCELITAEPYDFYVADKSRKMCSDFSAVLGERCDVEPRAPESERRLPSPGCIQARDARLQCQVTFDENLNDLPATCVQVTVGKGESCPGGRNGRPFCSSLDVNVSLFCNSPPDAVFKSGPGPGGVGGGFEGNGTCFELAQNEGQACGADVFVQCDGSSGDITLECREGKCVKTNGEGR